MMLRQISIAVISLAIIVACYLLYTAFFSPPPVTEPMAQSPQIPVSREDLTTRPAIDPLTQREQALTRGEGEKLYFERTSQPDGRMLYQFRADHWRPTGDNAFILEKPELRVFLKSGQIVHVSANEGLIETMEARADKPEPKKGELTGKVHIIIDRGTDPERSDPELRPADIVHIWLEKVAFDLETSRIDSDSAMQVYSYEAELLGKGLHIRWDEAASQLKELTIVRGEKLILHRGADMVQLNVPGASQTEKKPKPQGGFFENLTAPAAARRARMSVPTSQQADAPPPATTTSTRPSARAYRLAFERDVRIFQYDGPKLAGRMTCETLDVLFSIPRSRDRVRQVTDQPTEQRQLQPMREDGKRLEIFWEGTLKMVPDQTLPYSTQRQFHIIARGQPVLLEQLEEGIQGQARCGTLIYREESKQLELEGDGNDPVRIESEDKTRLVEATKLFYDRQAGVARGEGPGYMQQTRQSGATGGETVAGLGVAIGSDRQMTVLWRQGFLLEFGTYRRLRERGLETKPYLHRAEFRGGVKMSRPSESMAGELIALNFEAPQPFETSNQGVAEKIHTVHAEKNVVLTSEDQRIACQTLDVTFAQGKKGRVPKWAHAQGRVEAREGRRVIVADDLTTEMQEVASNASSGKTATTTESERAGWRLRKPKPSSKLKIALKQVNANGHVHIEDPRQKLDVTCQQLSCTINETQTMQTCELEGSANDWARAILSDSLISGHRVIMDLKKEYAHVPGPGELQFVNEQDIEGSKLRNPVPIRVRWAGSMELHGLPSNQGVFLGKVTVHSQQTTLNCGELLIDFEQVVRPKKTTETSERRFALFAQLLGTKRESRTAVKLPVTRKRPVYIRAIPETGEKVYVQNTVQEDNVLLSRTTMWGETLTVDLAEQRLNVPDKGQLLIEDYHLPKDDTGSAPADLVRDPFGTDLRGLGPSQTVFTWDTGLTYMLNTRRAVIDGNVLMRHVAGKVLLAKVRGLTGIKESEPKRRADLTCEQLSVEFIRGAFGTGARKGKRAGAAEVRKIVATGSVHLQENKYSALAGELVYDRQDNMIVVSGDKGEDAHLYQVDAEAGRAGELRAPLIVWDRQNHRFLAPGARGITTLR